MKSRLNRMQIVRELLIKRTYVRIDPSDPSITTYTKVIMTQTVRKNYSHVISWLNLNRLDGRS